jgi:hypothetical protein
MVIGRGFAIALCTVAKMSLFRYREQSPRRLQIWKKVTLYSRRKHSLNRKFGANLMIGEAQ